MEWPDCKHKHRYKKADLNIGDRLARYKIEDEEAWREGINELHKLGAIDLGPGVGFMPIPPFGGAVARFIAIKLDEPTKRISVYLDAFNSLGYWGPLDKPEVYWEIHPNLEGDCDRFDVEDTAGLAAAIRKALGLAP